MDTTEQTVVLHSGSSIELTMHITRDAAGELLIRADLSRRDAAEGESCIDRGKYRAFSNAVHSAVYAVPKSGVRMKPSYAISTNDQTGEVTCAIPAAGATEAEAVLNYLSSTASARSSALADH